MEPTEQRDRMEALRWKSGSCKDHIRRSRYSSTDVRKLGGVSSNFAGSGRQRESRHGSKMSRRVRSQA